MIGYFMKGVDLRDPRLSRDWRLWAQYFCWCIANWMSCHKPYLPIRLRCWLLRRFPQNRWGMEWRLWEFWVSQGYDLTDAPRPLPWPVCPDGFGPFVAPWNRVERWFRQRTGGRSHRCEFTDRRHGALYGGTDGAFMDRLFERFVENISDDQQP